MEHRVAGSLLGPGKYFRLDPEGLGDVSISEVNVESIAKMLDEGRKHIRRNEATFAELAAALGCGLDSALRRRQRRRAAAAAAAAAAARSADAGAGATQ